MDVFKRPKRNAGPSIGRDVDAQCGRCKRETGHTITAMVDAKVAQVRCNSCNSVHKYRATKAAKDASKAAKGGGKKDRGSSDIREYRRLIAGRDASEAQKHNLFRRPAEGDLITHKKFGLGVVHSLDADKAEVLFADGRRTLIVCR